MSITAKELAQKLNISAAAVSMALNHRPGVSRETRQTVLDAAEEYGFDFTKIQAKQKKDGSIYFAIYKKHGAIVTDTPFFSQLSEGVGIGCNEAGYKMKISYIYDDDETLERQVENIQFSDCCGMVLLGTEMTKEDYRPFMNLPFPVVLLDTYFETIPANYVLINNVQGAYLAVSYLIKRTKQQPGYLKSSYKIGNFKERANGFYNALHTNGMSASKSPVHLLTPSIEGAFADMLTILEQHEETAPCYFADNDLIAMGAMKAFKTKGYKIPEDISIIGFDNIPFGSVFEPPLSTIHVPKQDMGKIAANRLVALMENKEIIPLKIEISTRLVKRHSA